MAVSVKVIINGNEKEISLRELKLLLDSVESERVEPSKSVELPSKPKVFNISSILQDERMQSLYGTRMLEEFVDYWSEMMPNGNKQRWQKQKAFDVGRRLKTWAKRDYSGYFKRHKEERIIKEQEEYYREAEKRASKFMSPEEQKREIGKLAKGLFKNVNKL